MVLPKGLQDVDFDGAGGTGEQEGRREERGATDESDGTGSQDDGQGQADPFPQGTYYERYPQLVAARQAAALGAVGRPLTDAERARLNQGSANPFDVFGDLIDTGLTALPDSVEPFARQVLNIGIGVSQEGGETFLTTADGTKIARIETDSDTGATTIIRTPDLSTGGATPEPDDDTGGETVTTTVSLPGQGRGRPGLNRLIDPAEYSRQLDDAVQGGLDREALVDTVTSAITPVDTPDVFDVTFTGNQITITPQDPVFDPSRTTDPVFPTFQRPTLTRRPPDPSVVEVDYGRLFEGALGDFTGGEAALQRLLYFTTGIDIPRLSGPPPQPDDDDDNVAQAPSAFPQVASDAPTIDLESLKLNEIGILTNTLLGELVNVSAQQFEVQASILEAGAATAQGLNLLAVAQLPIVNSLASIDTTLKTLPETLDSIRFEMQRIADAPLVDQLVQAGVTFPQTLQERTDFPDVLSQGGISLFSAINNLNTWLSELASPELAPTPNLAEIPGSSEGNPLYAHIVNQPEAIDVRLVGGKIDSVGEIKGQVNVQHVGALAVTQGGEFVMRLASGETIPVYVTGGQVQANLSPGEIDALARAIDQANVVQSQLGFVSGS